MFSRADNTEHVIAKEWAKWSWKYLRTAHYLKEIKFSYYTVDVVITFCVVFLSIYFLI